MLVELLVIHYWYSRMQFDFILFAVEPTKLETQYDTHTFIRLENTNNWKHFSQYPERAVPCSYFNELQQFVFCLGHPLCVDHHVYCVAWINCLKLGMTHELLTRTKKHNDYV